MFKLRQTILLSLILLTSTEDLLAKEVAYSVSEIPDSLMQNAYAVVRNMSSTFIQNNKNQGTYKEHRVVTILDTKGENFANFSFSINKFQELSSFSGIIRDASGREVKSIKKGDLISSSINMDMMTLTNGSKSLFYECTYPTIPFTIEYTYEIKNKEGTLSYPPFYAIMGYNISTQNTSYLLEGPSDVETRYYSNFNCSIDKNHSEKRKTLALHANNLKAIVSEPMSPAEWEIFPHVVIAPSDFCYDSYCGNMKDWENYGLWVNELLKNRDVLPLTFVEELEQMTKDAKSKREKAKILYEYLQKNTRYVSIQLGIGGFQPISAETVYKTKFGDCKALSNMMKAMLKVIGIESNYAEIYLGEKRHFLKDFMSANQTNHVILMVPFDRDTVWLECTSNTTPFGYIHGQIAGHDALVISDKGGTVCRVPEYTVSQNLEESVLTLSIKEDGSAVGKATFIEHLYGFDYFQTNFSSNDRKEQINYLNRMLNIARINYGEIETSLHKDSIPRARMTVDLQCSDFANKTGSRLFVATCPLKKSNYNIFTSANRNLDVVREYGFTEKDSISYLIPEGFSLESLPKPIEVETPFGKYRSEVKQEGNLVMHHQQIQLYAGRFDKSQYQEIKKFYAQISSALKRRLVLKK